MQETTTENTTGSTPAAPRTDRLEVLKELSRGSIGVVRQARNPQLGRMLALRQFEVPEWLDDVDELIKRILNEARAASALDHPGIARLYTCGYKGFTIFVTSEFVEGQSLKELLGTRTPELAEVLAMAKQLCSALDYAHEKGVFHHFLNTSNIKVLPDGSLKILDFGLLSDKNLLSQTPVKKLANEPYLSPEQVKGKPIDRAANLFSAATILYELYTARNPFSGKHLGEVDRAILDLNPNALNIAHPRVPPAISNVILKALSKSPRERFSSGQQLMEALEAAKSEPIRVNGQAATPATAAPVPADTENHTGYNPLPHNVPPPAPKAEAFTRSTTDVRVQVGTAKHWKLVAGVVGCLVVVAGLAAVFQRKPTDVVPSPQPPAVVQKPAAVVQKAEPAQTATPPVAPAVPAVATAEPTPDDFQPLQTFAQPSVLTTSKRAKTSRASKVRAPRVPTTPQQGELTVSSVPDDATIEIDGRAGQSWRTPQTIGALAPGNYKLTVSKPGYATDVRTVQVGTGSRMAVDVRLTVVKGWLTVAGSPAGASVWIDGKDTGKVTPVTFMLDPAAHNVSLHKTGYLDAGSAIQLAAGQNTSYSPTLMAAGRTDNIRVVGGGIGRVFSGGGSADGKGRIEIRSEPKGAQVIINGTPLQKTTPLEIQVEAGNYDIILQKDGYKAVHENAIVGIEDRVKIEKTLIR
jgi:eukaryotic-like serine/threonine-protein kinase